MNNIAIILTSIERPQLLKKCLQSIFDNWCDDFGIVIIGNQCKDGLNYKNQETSDIIGEFQIKYPNKIMSIQLDYNCGIAHARNELIQASHALGYEYTLLTADSILFTDEINDIRFIIANMNDYSLIGLYLQKRIDWEGWLKLIPNKYFEMTFLTKEEKNQLLAPCNIVRNFWIAKTEDIRNIKYNEDLRMAEHEDWMWRFYQANYKIACTTFISGIYQKEEHNDNYRRLRQINWQEGQKRLKKLYKLQQWIKYTNLEEISDVGNS